ncbi:MAG: hypothetical protein QXE51_03330 [Nitrososphaeria archaeon]
MPTYQLIAEADKKGEFFGKATVTWLGRLKKAELSITSNSRIITVKFNNLIVNVGDFNFKRDVTAYTQNGENFLTVNLEWTYWDSIVWPVKTCYATLTVETEGIEVGTPSFIQDVSTNLQKMLGSLGWWGQIVLIVVLIVAIILAIAYALKQLPKGVPT